VLLTNDIDNLSNSIPANSTEVANQLTDPIILPIRLQDTRNSYFNGSIDHATALSIYPDWVNQPLYAVRARADHDKPPTYRPVRDVCCSFRMYGRPCQYELMLMSKRGNAVYSAKVRERFRPLSFLCKMHKKNEIPFLHQTNVKDYYHGSFLWVTLTYNTKLCSIDDAWHHVGQELNQYLASVRQKYGKISILRNYEAFKNGYPHIHALIYFHDHEFLIKKWYNKPKKSYEYIVVSKSPGRDNKLTQDKKYLHDYWHSYIKCTAVKDIGAVGYTLKYITKEMYQQNNYSTSANLWLDIKCGKSFWTYLGTYVAPYQYEKWHVRPKKPPDWDKFEDGEHEDADILGSWVSSGLEVAE